MTVPDNDVEGGLQHELPALWRFALKLTTSEDDAADLVQRTCLRALEQQQSYQANGKLRSWLFRIEHRIWLNELRSRQVRQHSSFTNLQDADLDAGGQNFEVLGDIRIDHPEGTVLFHQIVNAVNALPESQRVVVLLVYVEGFTYKEAAEILDTPIGTIMSRLSRARITIGEALLICKDKKSTQSSSTNAEVFK